MSTKASLDGLEVEVFRSKHDGKLVVDIETHDLQDKDTHRPFGVPDIRVAINSYSSSILPDGNWSEE